MKPFPNRTVATCTLAAMLAIAPLAWSQTTDQRTTTTDQSANRRDDGFNPGWLGLLGLVGLFGLRRRHSDDRYAAGAR